MNNIDKQYQALLQDILDNGVEKKDRTGTGTISVFGRQIRHKMSEGFPLLTTKKMYFKGIVTELIWFLRGDTNIRYLLKNDCHIWDGDAYKNYEKIYDKNPTSAMYAIDGKPQFTKLSKEEFINRIIQYEDFAEDWGDLGRIYGAQWRSWYTKTLFKTTIKDPLSGNDTYIEGDKWIDQIADLINDLKTNPDSRRMMVNAWNVGEIEYMVLPPCHYGFQVYTRELSLKERSNIYFEQHPTWVMIPEHQFFDQHNIPVRAVSLMWNQRSVDTFLGLPFNIASYGLLLEIIAKEVNMVPDELIGNLGDTHLYLNHIEQAKEQIGRKYTPEERHEMLKKSMGDSYQTAVDDQVPFGGGLSEYYESYKIPYRTREPFELPTLKIYSGELDDIAHHEIDDFVIENYKSHSVIKGKLSN